MAWEDRTTFETIAMQFGLKNKSYRLNAFEMKPSSFRMWRKRVREKTKKVKEFCGRKI
jgi:uncharacterized protein (TIGR03643 family)